MNIQQQIDEYIASQPEPKRAEMQELHGRILQASPGCRLWFTDGKNSEGKITSNPTIGYGLYTIQYANGTTRDFFRVGLLANTVGISVHILGIEDKAFLSETFGERLGKASVTGYCIKFRSLKNIDIEVLEEAIRYGLSLNNK
jgi:hypothetical protein